MATPPCPASTASTVFLQTLTALEAACLVHDGAWVRHLGERLAELFIILEAAILSHMTLVKDMRVAIPTNAQPWQQLADVRRTLLLNSFSYLPVQLPDAGPAWHLLADHHFGSHLANKVGKSDEPTSARPSQRPSN